MSFCPLKWVNQNKYFLKIMLISDYLSSNVITCIYFFDLTHFREGRNTKTFFFVFGSNGNFKFASEIYWPLVIASPYS